VTECQVEKLAEEVLAAHSIVRLPVDPLALANLERIQLAPGRYGGHFDGRIEYRTCQNGGTFFLFYEEADPPRRPKSRVRFSVAHELGHYFLPSHREYLVSGEWYGKRPQVLRSRRVEREADWFAAALLMPRQPFIQHARHRRTEFCSLGDLSYLADRVFQTSLTSTVLRYVQLNFAPCCTVLSDANRVLYCARSECLRQAGNTWVDSVPACSLTGRLRARQAGCRPTWARGFTDATVWLQDAHHDLIWEEVKVLGNTGRMLTYLVLPAGSSCSHLATSK
jgi:hypothetical protein